MVVLSDQLVLALDAPLNPVRGRSDRLEDGELGVDSACGGVNSRSAVTCRKTVAGPFASSATPSRAVDETAAADAADA